MTKQTQQARLDAALRRDMKFARERGKHNSPQGLRSSVSREAFFNAVKTEGPEVLTEAGEGYWRDMERRYPHLNLTKYGDTGDSPNGHKNRWGNVSERYVAGNGWFVWSGGRWRKRRRKPASRFREWLGNGQRLETGTGNLKPGTIKPEGSHNERI